MDVVRPLSADQQSILHAVSPFYLIAGSLSVAGGLAWNDAIQTVISTHFPAGGENVFMKFVYAITVTALIVLIAIAIVVVSAEAPVIAVDVARDAAGVAAGAATGAAGAARAARDRVHAVGNASMSRLLPMPL